MGTGAPQARNSLGTGAPSGRRKVGAEPVGREHAAAKVTKKHGASVSACSRWVSAGEVPETPARAQRELRAIGKLGTATAGIRGAAKSKSPVGKAQGGSPSHGRAAWLRAAGQGASVSASASVFNARTPEPARGFGH